MRNFGYAKLQTHMSKLTDIVTYIPCVQLPLVRSEFAENHIVENDLVRITYTSWHPKQLLGDVGHELSRHLWEALSSATSQTNHPLGIRLERLFVHKYLLKWHVVCLG